jgi:sterol desaturase/sphingolipid hydroxylase (fatty acid hydroxylase superfamily)
MTDQEASYKIAKTRAKEKAGFFLHLVVFLVIITLLTIINLATNPQYFWVKWPLMGWGIGLLFQALTVFVFSENSSVYEKMIDQEMRKQGWERDPHF